jgi:hypothetical protein
MLNKNLLVLSLLLLLLQPYPILAEQIRFLDEPVLYFADTHELTVNAEALSTLESFVRNWSQFEILVPKDQFPIDAPNCKQTVQIRFKGIEPVNNMASATQKARWDLLEKIRNKDDRNVAPLIVAVDTSQYVKRLENGKLRLSYCNVFIDEIKLQ